LHCCSSSLQLADVQTAGKAYFPGAAWQRKQPAEVGMNPQLRKEAIDFSIASETKPPRDLKLNHYLTVGREPFGEAIGPIKNRWRSHRRDRALRLHRRRMGRALSRRYDPQRHQELPSPAPRDWHSIAA